MLQVQGEERARQPPNGTCHCCWIPSPHLCSSLSRGLDTFFIHKPLHLKRVATVVWVKALVWGYLLEYEQKSTAWFLPFVPASMGTCNRILQFCMKVINCWAAQDPVHRLTRAAQKTAEGKDCISSTALPVQALLIKLRQASMLSIVRTVGQSGCGRVCFHTYFPVQCLQPHWNASPGLAHCLYQAPLMPSHLLPPTHTHVPQSVFPIVWKTLCLFGMALHKHRGGGVV